MDLVENKKRKYYFFFIFLLAVIAAFSIKLYTHKKKENQALKLKIIMLNKERRRPKPWGKLLNPQPIKPPAPTSTPAPQGPPGTDVVSTQAAAPTRNFAEMITDRSVQIKNLSTEELANLLNIRMARIKTFNLDEIQRTIDVADELIAREPETFSAYKAKLIALLTKEGRYNISVDDEEVNTLLEDMAAFDLNSDKILRKEAALLSNAGNEMSFLSNRLNDLTNQRIAVENEMADTSIDDPNYRTLEAQRAALSLQEEEALRSLSNVQQTIEGGAIPEEYFVDEDIVQIPFMRMMAKEDYSSVLENAETFIERFPASPIGYLYLVLSLEKLGRKEETLNVIANSRLSKEDQSRLLERLDFLRTSDPKKYWEQLNF